MIIAAVEDHYEPPTESIKTLPCQEFEIIPIDSEIAQESRQKSHNWLFLLNNKSVTQMK